MKEKLHDYIESVFSDAPACKKTAEIKEEFYQNLCDKYDDLIESGRTPAAAYNIAISSVGDISDLIDSLKSGDPNVSPTGAPSGKASGSRFYSAEEREELRRYRVRSGILTSIAVALYILCWVPLVAFSVFWDPEFGSIFGIVMMMVMIAVATALLIIKDSMKPTWLSDRKSSSDPDGSEHSPDGKQRKSPVQKALGSALWILTVAVYLLVSFQCGAWHLTWLIFLIAVALDNIMDALFALARKEDRK